ncbi:S1C family serine protease [Aquibacillus salsiterrae]|uniref:Trypsin-like peptidase domain-containing protein n=1 Tax=Aquibacillus salsiterrae TaxID=2950439 RepID=A0A9X3WH27_9BACI|nr:trypsin-like peptidase domain-containing protein [Aquibacillus salsiterrae]MDC3418488.1 trypsin-like peptidase domain-containing protein [Aquibacillus salsiterrae]
MGYYDHHYKPTRKRRSNWLIPTFIGIVIGIFIAVLGLPNLIGNNGGANGRLAQVQTNEELQLAEDSGTAGSLQQLNVDVTTRVTDIVQEVATAVVGVVNIQGQGNFWDQGSASNEAGTGSGVIYKVDNGKAFVVTNHHVIQGADEVEVVLPDGSRVSAELLGGDLFTDLAVLEMDSENVDKVVELGNSDTAKVGEPVLAIGSPLGLYLSGSVTQGIISGKQRAIPQDFDGDGRADWQAEVIQTDAAINPGNSGGALINMRGQLIGINSMKIAQSEVEGIGFAIPINDAIPIIKQLETEGSVTRAYLGVEAYSLEDVAQVEWQRTLQLPKEVESGIYLRSIEPMSPADQAGLQPYDVITKLDDVPIQNIIGLRKHLYQNKQVGDQMTITFYREGQKMEKSVTLAAQEY